MHGQSFAEHYLTLTEAAKIAPGRPSTNCMWRWCRRGVISRSGDRIRLQHARIGGKIFTTTSWLEEFGRKLADADAQYFELAETAAAASRQQDQRRRRQSVSKYEAERRRQMAEVDRRLEEAGI